MKHYTLIILGIVILLSACRKENSLITGEIDNTEETEFDAVVFRGTVSDKEQEGLQTTIDIYQLENLIGTVNSDPDGNYITENVFIEPDVEVTLDIYSENYRNKYRRLTKGKGLHDSQDFTLIAFEDSFGGPTSFVENPGSEDLIKVYRTILDVNGEPIPNIFCTVSYDIQQIDTNIFSAKGGIDITDENGYMEVLVPKNEELFHSAAPFFDDNNIECVGSFINRDTMIQGGLLPYQYLGIVSEDYEITESPEIAIHPTTYTVSGRLLNCDNTPVSNGLARITATYSNGTFPNTRSFETTIFDSNGNFNLEFELCHYGDFNGVLYGVSDDGLQSAAIFDGTVEQNNSVADLVICGNTLVDDSYMNLQIGSVMTLDGITFPQSTTTESSILALGFHPDHGNLQLNVNDIAIGDNPIDLLNLNFNITDKPYGFRSISGELNLKIETIQDDYITGTIYGMVETNENGVQEVTGELYIKYQ